MKHLVIVRHGEYTPSNGSLTHNGIEQMRRIGRQLKEAFPIPNIAILSSGAPRAVESANVIGKILGLKKVQVHAALWSGERVVQNNALAMSLIGAAGLDCEVLVVVTHLEYCRDLPALYRRRMGLEVERGDLGRGEAYIIDFPIKLITKIR